jgi:hypothetical protein
VTRIPELEQELVSVAARLQSPRRVLRPPVRAALAAAVVAIVVAVVVVDATENDRTHRDRQPTGISQRGAKVGIDVQAGVRFRLAGRQLTVSLFPWAPNETHNAVAGARLRATCGVAFAQVGPEGDPRNAREERTRLWPAGRDTLRFRFARDISKDARWCRVEDPAVGHVAFVRFGSAPVRPLSARQRIEYSANAWARLFAASDPAACDGYMAQPACERMGCARVGNRPIPNCTRPSPAFRKSFRGARVERVAIAGERFGEGSQSRRAAVRFSNGRTVLLISVGGGLAEGGVWWIEKFQGNPGRRLFEK